MHFFQNSSVFLIFIAKEHTNKIMKSNVRNYFYLPKIIWDNSAPLKRRNLFLFFGDNL